MLDQMYGVNESIPAAYNVVVTVTVLQLIFVLCVCCLSVQVNRTHSSLYLFFPHHHVMSTHSSYLLMRSVGGKLYRFSLIFLS